jgi:hypothetical protein
MKRTHKESLATSVLPIEIYKTIGDNVYEPWFLDLRAFLRWHQCCRANWRTYCEMDQSALHYILTQKHEKQCKPSRDTMHVDATLNCGRLKRAIAQSTALIVIEEELKRAPQNSRILNSGTCVFVSLVDLNEAMNFNDYNDETALVILNWCDLYVSLRYHWHMQLLTARDTATKPWVVSQLSRKNWRLAFSYEYDLRKL